MSKSKFEDFKDVSEIVEISDYFECKKCDKNSYKDEYCPCPRGSCEATLVGTLAKTIKIVKHK